MPKTKIVAAFGKRAQSPAVESGGHDPTHEFAAETGIATRRPESKMGRRRQATAAGVIAALLIAAVLGAIYSKGLAPAAAAAVGSLRIESQPSGAEVRLNGAARGVTPLSLSMPAGQYTLAVRNGSHVKQLPVTVTSGTVTVHHIEWTGAPSAAVPESGSLSIAADTSGGVVTVDGEERGAAPLTLRNLSPGQHKVVVRANGTSYTRTVLIEAGAVASLFVGGPSGTSSGWISVASPVAVQVFEGQRLIGTSEIEKIMLPAGEHELELRSEQLGLRTTRKVKVASGQTATVAMDVPRAPLSINAVPWAEVFIDGNRIGETPLGSISQPLGQHEIVFRHPQLGERRMTALVTLRDVNRISMDMRQR